MRYNLLPQIRTITITFLLLLSAYASSQSNGFETIRSIELMDQIYENLDKYYVDEIQPGTLSKIAIDAMLKELDPYTVYYHESNIEDYQLMTTGQYGGIGSLIRQIGDYVFIAEPYEGSPSEKAGLNSGDKIVEIDGKSMEKKNSEEVSTALKGPKGTSVEILIERNNERKTINITRDEIKLPDVPYSGMLDTTIGYIKLNSFTRSASTDVKKAFVDLKSNGMQQLIFDLRGNGGGLLIEAVKIVNMFVEKNQVVVNTQGRIQEENRTYLTLEEPVDLEIPIVVLVDGGSASASEIVSGCLQDLDRAVILGTRSYGKGLVQRTYNLDYGSKIKLTIAKYYTPSGRCVQRLEYYDKEDGENAEEIPDSLVTVFYTKNGREVIDGRGIDPDIQIEKRTLSRLALTIGRNNLFFDYATDYFYAHDTIPPAREFNLMDEEYTLFKEYVLEKAFSYATASEEMMKKLKETAIKEGFYEDSKAEYESLMQKVVPSKERDLEKFQDQIRQYLENEIVSRYYYQSGRAQYTFKNDPYIQKSLELLQNKTEHGYNNILGN